MTGVPVIFEVLATDDLAQAEARAGGAHGNKGWEAAEAALEMAWLLDALPGGEIEVIVDKPWGKVATYALNQPSSVRVITVEPEQETSVHYHRMRDEMWVVLDEGLTIEIGNKVVEAQPGEEFMIPAEETHRIRNARQRPAAGSWRSRTATPPRTTPSASKTPTADRSSRTGEPTGRVGHARQPSPATPILPARRASTCVHHAPGRQHPVLVHLWR